MTTRRRFIHYQSRWFTLHTAQWPRWHVRVWRIVAQWWPNEPWHRKLEVLFR